MKVKLKNKKVVLPNTWKQCGVSYEDWQELQKNNEINLKTIDVSIENMVDKVGSKKKGDK